MKRIAACLILVLPFECYAQTEVHEIHKSSATLQAIQVDFTTAVNLSTATALGELSGRSFLKVCNESQFGDVFLGYDSVVSSLTTSNYQGTRLLARGNSAYVNCLKYNIGDAVDLWAISQSTTTNPRITIDQRR